MGADGQGRKDRSDDAGPSDLIDAQVFQQIEVDVSLENLTSGTGVSGHSRTFGQESVQADADPLTIRLMELRDGGVSLDVPSKSGALGHVVRLGFDVRGANLPFNFTVKGNVVKVEGLDVGREKFDVAFTEFDREFMGALRTIFEQRQAEIEKFLEDVRG
jgi:hypothetical protein